MRCLDRNKKTIYYALYQGKTEIVDSNGNRTGQYRTTYGTPTAIKTNVSASKGTTDLALFGTNIVYDRTFVVDDVTCAIDEFTKLWVDKAPYDSQNNLTTHDYIVVKKAQSINSITYAITKVDVSANN